MADTTYNTLLIQQNLTVNAKNLNVYGQTENQQPTTENENEGEDIVTNLIFDDRIFDTNEKLVVLRNTIAQSIDLGEYAIIYGGISDTPKIDPQMKNEWFFILAALNDACVLHRKKVTDVEYIKQMISLFPNLKGIVLVSVEELDKAIRQLSQSISVERRKWKVNNEVVRLVDLQAKRRRLTQIDSDKFDRIYRIAFTLYTNLCHLVNQYK